MDSHFKGHMEREALDRLFENLAGWLIDNGLYADVAVTGSTSLYLLTPVRDFATDVDLFFRAITRQRHQNGQTFFEPVPATGIAKGLMFDPELEAIDLDYAERAGTFETRGPIVPYFSRLNEQGLGLTAGLTLPEQLYASKQERLARLKRCGPDYGIHNYHQTVAKDARDSYALALFLGMDAAPALHDLARAGQDPGTIRELENRATSPLRPVALRHSLVKNTPRVS